MSEWGTPSADDDDDDDDDDDGGGEVVEDVRNRARVIIHP